MSAHKSDAEMVRTTHNTARFFVENPQIAWVLLIGVVVWGVFGYLKMPQRKDPDMPPKQAMVIIPWGGASAEKIEKLVVRTVEQTVASNSNVAKVESTSRSNVGTVIFTLSNRIKDPGPTLDDIGGRLNGITNLPDGAGPIQYVRDFGDTATLLLTVATPRVGDAEIDMRAAAVRAAIEKTRPANATDRTSLVVCLPPKIDRRLPRANALQFAGYLVDRGLAKDARVFDDAGFLGIDLETSADEPTIFAAFGAFLKDRIRETDLHPDAWQPAVIRDPATSAVKLRGVAGEKYSYRELDEFTDLMEKALLATHRKLDGPPLVAKVARFAVLPESIYLFYSQDRFASLGIGPETLQNALKGRNITIPGGQLELAGKSVAIGPSGEFRGEDEIGSVMLGATQYGAPLYMRDVADTMRTYQSPPQYLGYYNWRDAQGQWQRTRAVSLSVQMGSGQKIDEFAKAVYQTIDGLKSRLPQDLIVARTSDQPQQVKENVDLFMQSLYEAVALVVLVSLLGFWEWRSALLMAISMPITLLMTFGMMYLLGLDLQQVSIASLIIALGLLVDDPVVAGDAIKRDLALGNPPIVASWLGPTKLATAILYATLTNIVAYMPFLMLSGNTGQFIYSLPMVIGCSLLASRLVSMSFIPFLGRFLLRPVPEKSIAERRESGFAAAYYRLGQFLIRRRWLVLAGSFGVLAAGMFMVRDLKQQFFPKDLSYLAYVDVYLPDDASIGMTNSTTRKIEQIVQRATDEEKRPLQSINTYVGGGGPRFWYSLAPEPKHANYAQIVLLFKDKHDTLHMLPELQSKLDREIAGARIDVRMLETGDAVGLPVQVRISGDNIETLRDLASKTKNILATIPKAARPRDDWGEDRFDLRLNLEPDRANMAGLSNLDAAASAVFAINGRQLTTLREGDKQIPVIARLRPDERAGLDDVSNMYVYAMNGTKKIPLQQISQIGYEFRSEVIRRVNQFRTVTVSAIPVEGALASEVMKDVAPRLKELEASLPSGYRMEIGGEQEKQEDGFGQLATVLAISVVAIFLALAFQFKNAVKPLIVFAAVPFGAVGALALLWVMGAPFGFMAFLGVVSLVGVIVSHVIVLFDFIEERHAEGDPFIEAVLDAGIMRLRPVMITVGATVIALIPLAMHGGPLWEPMCYAQIGGLTAATFITLLLVPVIYAIFVLDLKWVKWNRPESE